MWGLVTHQLFTTKLASRCIALPLSILQLFGEFVDLALVADKFLPGQKKFTAK